MEDMWRRAIYPVYHFPYSYLSNRQPRRKFINIYHFAKSVQITAQNSWIQQILSLESLVDDFDQNFLGSYAKMGGQSRSVSCTWDDPGDST